MKAYQQCTRLRRTRSGLSNVDHVQSLLTKEEESHCGRKKKRRMRRIIETKSSHKPRHIRELACLCRNYDTRHFIDCSYAVSDGIKSIYSKDFDETHSFIWAS